MNIVLNKRLQYPSLDHLPLSKIQEHLEKLKSIDILIEAHNPLVLDYIEINSIDDWNVFLIEDDNYNLRHLTKASIKELHQDYAVGIESMSDLLINRGIWNRG